MTTAMAHGIIAVSLPKQIVLTVYLRVAAETSPTIDGVGVGSTSVRLNHKNHIFLLLLTPPWEQRTFSNTGRLLEHMLGG